MWIPARRCIFSDYRSLTKIEIKMNGRLQTFDRALLRLIFNVDYYNTCEARNNSPGINFRCNFRRTSLRHPVNMIKVLPTADFVPLLCCYTTPLKCRHFIADSDMKKHILALESALMYHLFEKVLRTAFCQSTYCLRVFSFCVCLTVKTTILDPLQTNHSIYVTYMRGYL